MRIALSSLIIATLMTACVSNPQTLPSPENNQASIAPNQLAAINLVKGQQAFSADLYKELLQNENAENENLFISPLSISSAFGLAYAGAKGQTAQEISQVLHYNLPEEELHKAMGSTLTQVQDEREGQVFQTANALFTDKQTKFNLNYIKTVRQFYGVNDMRVDYRNNSKQAVDKINQWVSRNTQGLIPKTLEYEQITKNTRNVLVNTAYLKAAWAGKFIEENTKEDTFYGVNGAFNVPMMQQKSDLRYISSSGFSAIEMPYQGHALSMVAILPKRRKGLVALDHKFSAEFIDRVFTRLNSAETYEVDIRFPKVDLSADYKLKAPLIHMGMNEPFSKSADFSGRIPHDAQWPTKLNEVIHKTILKIDEKGTEAAAVTAIDEIITVGARLNKRTAKFHADHPFLILIRHNETGAVLFMGRIVEPVPKGLL